MSIKSNTYIHLLGNLVGKAWTAAMSIAFVPLFLLQLGSEGYGLIGVYISIYALVGLLDLGLNIFLNQSLAVLEYNCQESKKQAIDTLKTFERVYLAVAIFISVGVSLIAPLIAEYWLQVEDMTIEQVTSIIRIMSWVIFCQWPATLYTGGLLGIGKQVELNIIKGVHATLQWGGTLLFLLFVNKSLESYFFCQLVVNAGSSLWMRTILWSYLKLISHQYKGYFKWEIILESKRFLSGLGFYSVVVGLILLSDRLMVSKLLPLESMGYYVVATQIASVMMYIGVPIYNTVFPKISKMIYDSNPDLELFYNKTVQLMGLLSIPLCLVLVGYSYEVTLLWSGNSTLATKTSQITSFTIVNLNLYILSLLPQCLFLGIKWTKPMNLYNGILLLFLPAVHYICIGKFGLVGASITMGGYFLFWHLFLTPIAHKRFFKSHQSLWFIRYLCLPTLTTAVAFYLAKQYISVSLKDLSHIPIIVCLWLALCVIYTLTSPDLRDFTLQKSRRLLFQDIVREK